MALLDSPPEGVLPTDSASDVVAEQNSLCPMCGSELRGSKDYPHGRDSGNAIRKARICHKQGLCFGLASDGSWSISLAPLNIITHQSS
jgi:hypothetical protein